MVGCFSSAYVPINKLCDKNLNRKGSQAGQDGHYVLDGALEKLDNRLHRSPQETHKETAKKLNLRLGNRSPKVDRLNVSRNPQETSKKSQKP